MRNLGRLLGAAAALAVLWAAAVAVLHADRDRARGRAERWLHASVAVPVNIIARRGPPLPLRRAPDGSLAWWVAYGPRHDPREVAFEVYVRPFQGVVATHPPDLAAHIAAHRHGDFWGYPPAR